MAQLLLQSEFVSQINALSKLPTPIFKYIIDQTFNRIKHKFKQVNIKLLQNILARQKIPRLIVNQTLKSLPFIYNLFQSIIKIGMNEKQISILLLQNTLLQVENVEYITLKLDQYNSSQKLATNKQQDSHLHWSIFNLKKSQDQIINKMYVKVSLPAGKQERKYKYDSDKTDQTKTVTLSLIDFKILLGEIQTIKNYMIK